LNVLFAVLLQYKVTSVTVKASTICIHAFSASLSPASLNLIIVSTFVKSDLTINAAISI